ncbi:hypothetical protein B0H14DRAFT_2617358 [Mycena olivaceomarginata]|nr:hypothetical protein B0H14DRAFT_2617358 [Mycena olivaceomarginata]
MSALPEKDRDRVKSGWCMWLLLNYMFSVHKFPHAGAWVFIAGCIGLFVYCNSGVPPTKYRPSSTNWNCRTERHPRCDSRKYIVLGNALRFGTREAFLYRFVSSKLDSRQRRQGQRRDRRQPRQNCPHSVGSGFVAISHREPPSIGLRNMDYVAQQQNKRGKPSSGFIKLKERRKLYALVEEQCTAELGIRAAIGRLSRVGPEDWYTQTLRIARAVQEFPGNINLWNLRDALDV